VRAQKAMGNKWARIALLLPGRTGKDVHNRWTTIIQKERSNSVRSLRAWTPIEDELLKSIVASKFTSRAGIQWSVVSGVVSFVRMRAALDCSLMCCVIRTMVSKMMREQSSGPPRTSKQCRERYLNNFVDGLKKNGIPSSERLRICVRVGLWFPLGGKDLTDVTGVCVCVQCPGRQRRTKRS
jgi:hypothetical protein